MTKKKEPEKGPDCPKCGTDMDDRGDGVLVCGECGWQITKKPAAKKV